MSMTYFYKYSMAVDFSFLMVHECLLRLEDTPGIVVQALWDDLCVY